MSGADLAYAEMLARAGRTHNNAVGLDAARLKQMESDAADDGSVIKFWDYTKAEPDIIEGFKWIVFLSLGENVPSWLPVGSLIIREG